MLLDNFAAVVHIHTMPKELDLSAAENCVCFNLRWVTRAVTPFYDAEMRRHGIRPTQGPILESLKTKDSWNMAELSDWLGMERTTLVRNLRPLQRDGLVRVSGGGRGRLVELAITAKGRKQIEKLAPAWKSAQRAAVKTLGEKRSPPSDDHCSAYRMAHGDLDGGRVFQAGRDRSAPAVSEGGGVQDGSGWLDSQNLHRDRGSPSARRLGLPSRGKNPGAIRGCGTTGPKRPAPDAA